MDHTARRSIASDRHEFTVSPDRFARTDGRPHRPAPLTRKIEVAHLLPTLNTSHKSENVPQCATFDATASALARGTLVRTIHGDVAIEDIQPGDYLETSAGEQPVLWVGARDWIAAREKAPLLRVTAHAFGPGKPEQDCVFGPSARLRHAPAEVSDLWDGAAILSPLRDFEDGDSVVALTPPAPVRLYHIVLRRHATFKAGGLEIESYHPGERTRDTVAEALRDRLISLFPHVSGLGGFGPLCLPRVGRNKRGDFAL